MKDIKIKTLTQQARPRARRLQGLGAGMVAGNTNIAGSGLTVSYLEGFFVTHEAAASSYVTEIEPNGDLVTWRRNGQLHSFTVPYAVRSAEVMTSGSSAIDANAVVSGLRLGVYSGLDPASTNFPAMTSGWCNTLINIGLHESNLAAQLFFGYGLDMMFRPMNEGVWRTVLDSANYAQSVDATHLRRDGTTPMLGDLPMDGHRIYLDAARTVYLWYDAEADCVRCNKTIASDGNVTAYSD